MSGDFRINNKIEKQLKKSYNEIESIQILSQIIANRIIEKIEKDEQFRNAAATSDIQICQKRKAA